MLMCIPSFNESVARAIADRFGSVGELRNALQDLKAFPEIRISPTSLLGKARIKRLAAAFACRLKMTVLRVGKHKGKSYSAVAESDRSYCSWVLRLGSHSTSSGLDKFASYLKKNHKANSTRRSSRKTAIIAPGRLKLRNRGIH